MTVTDVGHYLDDLLLEIISFKKQQILSNLYLYDVIKKNFLTFEIRKTAPLLIQ